MVDPPKPPVPVPLNLGSIWIVTAEKTVRYPCHPNIVLDMVPLPYLLCAGDDRCPRYLGTVYNPVPVRCSAIFRIHTLPVYARRHNDRIAGPGSFGRLADPAKGRVL